MAGVANMYGHQCSLLDGGRVTSTPTLPRTPTDPFRRWAREGPHRVALRDRVRATQWTYAALDAEAERWAAWLARAGVGAGDRVAVIAGNRIEHVLLLAACLRRRAALVPLNWRLAPPELRAVLADAEPRIVLGEARFCDAVGTGVPWHDLDAITLPSPDARAVAEVPREWSDIGMILYTSGSTGRPKGAMLPLLQLVSNAIATVEAWRLDATDVAPITTPFFHTAGWHVFALPLWWIGGTVVLAEGFEPSTWLSMLADERCTVAFAVPTQWAMVAESPDFGRALPALRWCIAGGAPCPTVLLTRIQAAGYALREAFGMTEFGPNCFAVTTPRAVAPAGWVGWPVPYSELRLVDEHGNDVADGTPGELWLRGPQRFSGYLFDPERTAEALTADGWYQSGDVLVRDADGSYRVCGRRKEMFISGGENVYPGEVEAALVEHPAVAEAVVVALPDARWGEVGCAFIVARAGASVDAPSLVQHARARLAGYKVPTRVEVLHELPRLGSGKVDRSALAARVAYTTP
jgi:fatty-acyl-CoA synthase